MAKAPDSRAMPKRAPVRNRPTEPEVLEIGTGDIEIYGDDPFDTFSNPGSGQEPEAEESTDIGREPLGPPVAEEPTGPQRTKVLPREKERAAAPRKPALAPVRSADEDDEPTASLVKPPPPVEEPSVPALAPAFLFVKSGPGAGKMIPIPEGELSVGRSSSNGLVLSHSSISRLHATISRSGSRFYLRDAGSHNGTLVNKRRVQGKVELKSGDEISMGKVTLALRLGGDAGAHTATSVPLNQPFLRAAIFAGAVLLGVVAVFGVARFTKKAEEPEALTPRPAAPRPELPAPPSVAPPAPPARPAEDAVAKAPASRPRPAEDINLASEGEVSASEVFAQSHGRADKRPARTSPAPKREPAPARETARPSRPSAPPPEPPPTRVAKADPAPARGDSSEALALYEAGELDKSIAMANSAGDRKLAGRIADFKRESAEAHSALEGRDGANAIRHFTAALQVDDELSGGWGKKGGEIRVQLSKLYQAAGQQAQSSGDPAKAIGFYERALKYDPTNAKAKDGLKRAKASGGDEEEAEAQGPRKPVGGGDRRSAADSAFDQ